MPGLAFVLGGGFCVLRLLRRYPSRVSYAVRNVWGKTMIVLNALTAIVIYYALNAYDVQSYIRKPQIGLLLLAVASAALSVGLVSIVRIRPLSSSQSLVRLSVWVNETIEAEMDRLIAQKVTEIAIKIERCGIGISTLQNIRNHLVQYNCASNSRKRASELAKLDDMARQGNVAGVIGYLMLYCEPHWLADQAIIAAQLPPRQGDLPVAPLTGSEGNP